MTRNSGQKNTQIISHIQRPPFGQIFENSENICVYFNFAAAEVEKFVFNSRTCIYRPSARHDGALALVETFI